jgi:hypothetical protein
MSETICHCDASIWNFVFVEDRMAGIFDFDQACPGPRAWDLSATVFSAVNLVPYGYEPSIHAAERKRRIRLLFDAYGMDCPPGFPDMLIMWSQTVCDEMVAEAAAGVEGSVKMIANGGLAHYQRVASHMKTHVYEWF